MIQRIKKILEVLQAADTFTPADEHFWAQMDESLRNTQDLIEGQLQSEKMAEILKSLQFCADNGIPLD